MSNNDSYNLMDDLINTFDYEALVAEVDLLKEQLAKERAISEWLVSGSAVIYTDVFHKGVLLKEDKRREYISYYTGKEDLMAEVDIIDGDWRAAALIAMKRGGYGH